MIKRQKRKSFCFIKFLWAALSKPTETFVETQKASDFGLTVATVYKAVCKAFYNAIYGGLQFFARGAYGANDGFKHVLRAENFSHF